MSKGFIVRARLDNDGRVEATRIKYLDRRYMSNYYPQEAIQEMHPDPNVKTDDIRLLWHGIKDGVSFNGDTGEFETGNGCRGFFFVYQATRGRPDLYMPINFDNEQEEDFSPLLFEEVVKTILEGKLPDLL